MAMVESSANKESLGEDASKQRRIDAIDADEEITLVSVQDEVVSNDVDKEMFDVDVLDSEEVFVVEHEVAIKGVNNEVNFIEEVVEVINTTKLFIFDSMIKNLDNLSGKFLMYTRDFCCSKGNVKDKILVPKLPKNCARCGHPVDGPYCQGCDLLRKKLEEDLVTNFQDFQNTFESSDDSTNVVNAPREPFVVKQDHDVNSLQNPPHIDEFLLLAWDRVFENKNAFGNKQYKPEDMQELFRKLFNDVQNIHEELAEYINTPGWNRHAFYDNGDDDDVDYTIAITPVLSTEEPDNSLSMRDEHLNTILVTESDEVIKSSVEDLVPIPSESEGIPNTMCDGHLVNNPTPLEAKDHFEIVINSNDDISSSDDDSLYNENIEYVKALPHDSELVSLEVAKIVNPKDEEIEDDNLCEKLLNVNLIIAKIEALKDNPTPSSEFLTKSSSTYPKSFLEETNTFYNSLPEIESFCFIWKRLVFPPTDRYNFTHEEFADELAHIISPSEYDCFYFWNLPDPGEWISILNSGIRENLSSTTRVNLPVEDDHSPLLAYVVWIFLAYLTYPVIPPYLHSFGNEDTIFDPGIAINRFYSFKSGLSHRCGTFKKFNTHSAHFDESPMEMLFSTCFPMDQ
nr:hypothetical protein [Tanacetum cinerariifolium]